ncbi:AHH domain-containing protein [Motilimonas sp. E26]|nr:AHH domain-containing protein [Motilimonas sp. E26]
MAIEKYGVDINETENGTFLPTSTSVKNEHELPHIPHSRVHTNKYKREVMERITNNFSEESIKKELNKITKELESGRFKV